MLKFCILAIGSLVAFSGDAIAASVVCSDCSTETGLTLREQIKAERARDAERVAKESKDRPWDAKDLGQAKPAPPSPTIR
jgi:hypothetical protein